MNKSQQSMLLLAHFYLNDKCDGIFHFHI